MSAHLKNPAVGYRTRKGHSSFQFPRRTLLENIQTTRQFYSLPMKVKILQARIHLYLNWELPDWKTWFRKGRETKDEIANIHGIIDKTRAFQKNIYFDFIDYTKVFDCVNYNNWWKPLKEKGMADHLTCLLRNLHVGQEATVGTLYGTTDWFKIEKGVWQGCICSPCLFNLYKEDIK